MQDKKYGLAKAIKKLKAKLSLHIVNRRHKLKLTESEIDFIVDTAFEDD